MPGVVAGVIVTYLRVSVRDSDLEMHFVKPFISDPRDPVTSRIAVMDASIVREVVVPVTTKEVVVGADLQVTTALVSETETGIEVRAGIDVGVINPKVNGIPIGYELAEVFAMRDGLVTVDEQA